MRQSNRILAGAFVLAVGGSVGADQAGTPAKSGAETEMKAMDTNGDGKISPEEHAAGARRMFEAMDANKDGKVTAAEMDAAHERVTGQKAIKGEIAASEKIKAIDTDGDGILTAEEHAAGARKMFEQMDTDRDGFLSKEELAAGHAKMLHKAAQ
jgi:Ca2+-binding EF-hand superfamily protein